MKFAHMADAHLGAFSKNPVLRDLNLQAFEKAMRICIEENVDFIIIAGDLFHNPIPDMNVVQRAVRIMKNVVDKGIRIYTVYGSHDFSLGNTSLMDVLASTGLFRKVVNLTNSENGIRPQEIIDETGVKLVGLSGLSSSQEVHYFEALDRQYLENISNPKIFVFHTTIEELKPQYIADKHAVPKSLLPKGFDYYAGGHLHERIESRVGNAPLIYPGALFGATYNDLDILKERGFFIVEDFQPRFVKVSVCDFEKKVINADGLSAEQLTQELLTYASQNFENKVVILKVHGEMRSGKIGDIDFHSIREKIKRSALDLLLNTYALRTREAEVKGVVGESKNEIETRIFERVSVHGLNFTRDLFHILKESPPEGMGKRDFENLLWSKTWNLIQETLSHREEKREESEEKGRGEGEKMKIEEKREKERKGETLTIENIGETEKLDAERKREKKQSGKVKQLSLIEWGGDDDN